MLASHGEEEMERFGAAESQREKSGAVKEEEEGVVDEWSCPDGGLKAWLTVFVSILLLALHCSCTGWRPLFFSATPFLLPRLPFR